MSIIPIELTLAHMEFRPKTDHSGLHALIAEFDISLETYQLGQILTRSMLFLQNGAFGSWRTYGNTGEKQFADEAPNLDWKKKIELALKVKDEWLALKDNRINKQRYKLKSDQGNSVSYDLTELLYGDELIILGKGQLFQDTVELYKSYIEEISAAHKLQVGKFKLFTQSEFIRERNSKIEKVKQSLEFKSKKKFTRESMIEYNNEKDTFIYRPENHPYFREWLLYNYAFWSPVFKSRTLLDRENMGAAKTSRSRDLNKFLAYKFRLEHCEHFYGASVVNDNYSEEAIRDLLDSSFFRKGHLENVYQRGLIDRDIVAFVIESWEPFRDYKSITLDPKYISAADILTASKNKKKAA